MQVQQQREVRTASHLQLPKRYRDLVGKVLTFSGHLFTKDKEEPFNSLVYDVRLSCSTIRDLKDKYKRWPAVEYLILHPRYKERRWTKPFPIKEINLNELKEVNNAE